jgi:hypothetical protein
MNVSRDERDIIIVTGSNAVGKTTTTNYLRAYAKSHSIPHEQGGIADSQSLFEMMRLDDKAGGLHHTHDWCAKGSRGHSHSHNEPEVPFTITDNELPDAMRKHFFTNLTILPKTGTKKFVEWAGGVNINPPHDPTSVIDYSYATVKRIVQERSLPTDWLKRVFAVIHLTANRRVRFMLNKRRPLPSSDYPEEIETGTVFWQKDERILGFYGCDDFSEIESLFRELAIPIYSIQNDGDKHFYTHLKSVAEKLFLPSIVISDKPVFIPAQVVR